MRIMYLISNTVTCALITGPINNYSPWSCLKVGLGTPLTMFFLFVVNGPAGQGSVTDRNVCGHVLLHGGIKSQERGTALSDQNAGVCYNRHV